MVSAFDCIHILSTYREIPAVIKCIFMFIRGRDKKRKQKKKRKQENDFLLSYRRRESRKESHKIYIVISTQEHSSDTILLENRK